MKRKLAILISSALFVFLISVNSGAAYHSSYTYHSIALDSSFTGGSLSNGNYYLTEDIILTSPITIYSGRTVNLCLNGHVLKANFKNDPVISNHGTLTVSSCATTAHRFSVGSNGLWTLNANGTRSLSGGVITGGVSEFSGSSSGGGIAYNGCGITSDGTLTVESDVNIVGNSSATGAGVDIYGGTAYISCNIMGNINNNRPVSNGALNVYGSSTVCDILSGANISNNNCNGVHVSFGTLNIKGRYIAENECLGIMTTTAVNMTAGTIIENNGGVNVQSQGNFKMSGGSITENDGHGIYNLGKVTISGTASITNNTSNIGAGIYNSTSATLKITGGTISGNCAVRDSSALGISASGGGIYNYGNLDLANCSITGNSADDHGGGVYNYGGMYVNVAGAVKITDNTAGGRTENLYLEQTSKVMVGSLTSGANIGITLKTGTGRVSYRDSASYAARFFSDNEELEIINDSGYIALAAHECVFTGHTSDGNATCTENGTKTAYCKCGAKETITDEGSSLGHSIGTPEITKHPTYITKGEQLISCGRCDYSKTESIPATGSAVISDIDVSYEGGTLTLTNVPDDVTVVIAGYYRGYMAFVFTRSGSEISCDIPQIADKISVYVLYRGIPLGTHINV